MAPPTDSHLYWRQLRAFGLLLDLVGLIIIIIAGKKSNESTFGLIGIGLYFSIVLNLRGLLPKIPEDELPAFFPTAKNIRHGLRIGFEILGTALLVVGAVFYASLTSLRAVPLASIGAVVIFSLLSAFHSALVILDSIFTLREKRKPPPPPTRAPVSGRFRP